MTDNFTRKAATVGAAVAGSAAWLGQSGSLSETYDDLKNATSFAEVEARRNQRRSHVSRLEAERIPASDPSLHR